jgi:alpha-amylase
MVVIRSAAVTACAALALLGACAGRSGPGDVAASGVARTPAGAAAWTNGGTCYEVFVRSFFDSNGDGIGDIDGLIQKLDYINDGNPASTTDLGASCIWLMPVAASPSYHGYDVSDYYRVEPAYGTNDDFKRLVAAAHKRGIAILVDMVLNHSSSRHPYFQAALRDTTSPYRHWYRFSPAPLGKGPWGDVAWHPSPDRAEYYYGVFSSEMPDLDYHTPAVRQEAKNIAAFWLRDMGVDGFRLDAVPYLVEDGTCQMGCPGTHAFLHEYGAYVATVKPSAYTVGEAWGNIDAVLPYYPDQLTAYFGFELADSLLAAVRRGSTGGMLAGYLRLQDALPAYRFAPFLSNHDGTRTITALGGDMGRAKTAATLLLTLPGLPFVYYGEELGMSGDKPDPRLRTPMQWSTAHADGFTAGIPWERLQPDSQTVTVAAESADPGSPLQIYRKLIHLRKSSRALAAGRLVPLSSSSSQVAAYLRRDGDDVVLVLANLGSSPVPSVTIVSANDAVPPGRYATRALFGRAGDADVVAGPLGRLAGATPFGHGLAPYESVVLELVRR